MHGIFALVLPDALDLAAHQFVVDSYYALGDATGAVLKWQHFGDQRMGDPHYKSQRTIEQERIDIAEGKKFADAAKEYGGIEAYCRSLYESAAKRFNIDSEARPCIHFYTNPNVGSATLRIPPVLLESRQERAYLLRVLCDNFTERAIQQISAGGRFYSASLLKFAGLVQSVETHLADSVVVPSTSKTIAHQNRYATLVTHDGQRPISRLEYDDLVARPGDFDILCDELSSTIWKLKGDETAESVPASTFEALRLATDTQGRFDPCTDTRTSDKDDPKQWFQRARRRFDCRCQRGDTKNDWMLVRTSMIDGSARYSFDPAPTAAFALIFR